MARLSSSSRAGGCSRGTLATRLAILAGACLLAPGCAPERPGAEAAGGEALVLPEHYAHSIAAVGVPEARRAFQIGSGSVVSTGEVALEWTLAGTPGPVRTSPVWFERDGVPVAHWWMVSPGESLHFEAAAIRFAPLGDSSALIAIRVTAAGLSSRPREMVLEARVRGRPDGPGFVPWDAPDDTTCAERWDGRLALRNGRAVAIMDPASEIPAGTPRAWPARTSSRGPGALWAVLRATLARGTRREWQFWIPAYPAEPPLARRMARERPERSAASEARTRWRGWISRAALPETPDALVDAALRASLVTLVLCHERRDGEWIPIGNPFQYRDTWLRDGAQTIRALAVAGLTDLARSDAWSLRGYHLPCGAFISQIGQLDGTGQALWAMGQAAACPPSPEFARRVLPFAADGLRWIARQRALTRAANAPWSGLLPYADPRDNELVRAQLVGNDAWALTGVHAVASLARIAGDSVVARAADDAGGDYRATIVRSLARGRFADVPASWQGVGRDWGNACLGYPARALAPDDLRLAALARRMRRGGDAGTLPCYGSADTLHTYLAADLAECALLADRPAEARAFLGALLAHASSTLGFAETFSRRDGGFGANLPPHATTAARLVQLVRDMVVCDVRDSLELGLGAAEPWWNATRVTRAPTRFGTVDVALLRPAADLIEARWSPVSVPVRVRVPDGLVASQALGAGARVTDGRWIDCAGGLGRVAVRVRAAAARSAR
jgi:hypothetical protein